MDFLLLLWIQFDCNPVAFRLPFIHHPIAWYGCIFSLAFYIGYKLFIWIYTRNLLPKVSIPEEYKKIKVPPSFILNKKNQKLYTFFRKNSDDKKSLEKLNLQLYLEETFPRKVTSIEKIATSFADSALLYIIAATVVGARLGHILFYEDIYFFLKSPTLIFKTWEGGLASHGGILAILFAVFLFTKKNKPLSFLAFMDLLTIPTMFVCAWIRIGNFINQEILGSVSTLPWAVIFLHPAGGESILPRHPIQIYESILYFFVCFLLLILWKKEPYRKVTGLYTGLALSISFSVRFLLEFFKESQSIYDSTMFLDIGQILSIPMILCGILLVRYSLRIKDPLDKKGEEDYKELL
jgi:phosphatidylglycerol:prolipoprotein diacylglycerol transferase